jgi:hypothetical protein
LATIRSFYVYAVPTARQQFQRIVVFLVPDGARFARAHVQVPDDKILVIEHVSALGQLGTDQRLSVEISTQIRTGVSQVTHRLLATFEGQDGGRDLYVLLILHFLPGRED